MLNFLTNANNQMIHCFSVIIFIYEARWTMKKVIIYTDGACSNNQSKTNHGGYGAILEYKGHIKEIHGSEENTTTNRMEMKALIHALLALKETDIEIDVYSDSAYLIDCFTKKWYVSWEKNGWINSQKKPVENKDLWVELLKLTRSFHKINFRRIKGHLDKNKRSEIDKWFIKFKEWNGIEDYSFYLHVVDMNNRADELANVGVSSIKG